MNIKERSCDIVSPERSDNQPNELVGNKNGRGGNTVDYPGLIDALKD